MHFNTHPLTMRAVRSLCRGDHLDFDTAILLEVLLAYTQCSQFSWHHNPFLFFTPFRFSLGLTLAYALLKRHRLSSFDW